MPLGLKRFWRKQQTLILDQFTDTNGVALNAHVVVPTNMPGAAWVHTGMVADIQSNRASRNGTSGAVSIETRKNNVTVSSIVQKPTSSSGIGIIGRLSDNLNFWLLYVDNTTMYLYDKVAGVFTSRATIAITNDANDHTLALQMTGDYLRGRFDGTNAITYNSTFNQTATKCGLYADGTIGDQRRWDDFKVMLP